jgi:hypothetical protein
VCDGELRAAERAQKDGDLYIPARRAAIVLLLRCLRSAIKPGPVLENLSGFVLQERRERERERGRDRLCPIEICEEQFILERAGEKSR